MITITVLHSSFNLTFCFLSSSSVPRIEFHDRMKHYAESQMLGHELEIHWFSVLNSVVLVLLLTGFLFIILMRVLKADYVRYASFEDQDPDGGNSFSSFFFFVLLLSSILISFHSPSQTLRIMAGSSSTATYSVFLPTSPS